MRKSITFSWIGNIAVLLVLSPLIFGIWYPSPIRNVLNMGDVILIFFLAQAAIVVLLPLLLIRQGKTELAILIDWILIVGLEFVILSVGLFVLYNGRPVAIVFEQDRLVVVRANEVLRSEEKKKFNFKDLFIPRLVGVDLNNSKATTIELLAQSLQGIEPSQREDQWVAYSDMIDRIRSASRPVTDLDSTEYSRYVDGDWRATNSGSSEQLKYLPFTSSNNKNWIAFLDSSGYPFQFAPIDGFK